MKRILGILAVGLLALFIMAPGASAQRWGGGFRGGYYGGWYGPGWGWYGPGWGLGWYGPYWGYPGYGYGYGYAQGPRYGDVKIDAAKDALVYIDGGYAGKVGDLKKFHLTVGNHDLELRDPSGHAFHQEKIEVVAGKTLEISGSSGSGGK